MGPALDYQPLWASRKKRSCCQDIDLEIETRLRPYSRGDELLIRDVLTPAWLHYLIILSVEFRCDHSYMFPTSRH